MEEPLLEAVLVRDLEDAPAKCARASAGRSECCPCDKGGATGSFWVAFALLAVTAAVVLVFLEFSQYV